MIPAPKRHKANSSSIPASSATSSGQVSYISPNLSFSSQNPACILSPNIPPAILSPAISLAILSPGIPPAAPPKPKGVLVNTPKGMFLKMSDGKVIELFLL